MSRGQPGVKIGIACGGTGGHLFPGLAVGQVLVEQGAEVTLFVSGKDIDQRAVQSRALGEVVTLAARPWRWSGACSFAWSAQQSYRECRGYFGRGGLEAMLVMGGFTSLAPALAARAGGAKLFLHEANSVPGKANRLLARLAVKVLIGFPEAERWFGKKSILTGTPVRDGIGQVTEEAARVSLGLSPNRPTLLILGGSQGAHGINALVLKSFAEMKAHLDRWQFLHLTGEQDFSAVREGYQAAGLRAVVRPFLTEMELALGAGTVALSRAGASSLAEMAAVRLPAVLIPFPWAADDHQFYNAASLMRSGAALQLDQASATPAHWVGLVAQLGAPGQLRATVQEALREWHFPRAAQSVAEEILKGIEEMGRVRICADADRLAEGNAAAGGER